MPWDLENCHHHLLLQRRRELSDMKIFWLEKCGNEEDRLLYTEETRFETEPCEQFPDHAKRQRRTRPLRVIAPIRPLANFQWTPFSEAIADPTVRSAFMRAGLSGIDFRRVETYTTAGDHFGQELYELIVTGWGGVAPAESGVKVIEECPHCHRRVFSRYTSPKLLFNVDEWDGSDVFIIWPLPRFIFVVEEVKNLIEANGFSGVRARPLSELPQHPLIRTLTPGNIFDWLPDDRARPSSADIERRFNPTI
jgi:hypothetical protein